MEIKPFSEGERTIEAVIIDLDGTLLNSEHEVTERTRKALNKVREQGIKVILATGKTRKSAEPLIDDLNLDTPGIYVQGLVLYDAQGNVTQQQKLPAAALRRAVQFAESKGFHVVAYSRDRILTKRNNDIVDQLADFGEPMPQSVGPLVNRLIDTPINKLIIMGDDLKKLNALRWQLDQQIGTSVTFTTTPTIIGLEVLPKNSSKGNGVRIVLQQMGINPLNTVAIGDGENDVEMLTLAGLGIAMENASDSAKEAASEVVSSNDDDGVAEALEKFVLHSDGTDVADEADDDTADTDTTDDADAESTDNEETTESTTEEGTDV